MMANTFKLFRGRRILMWFFMAPFAAVLLLWCYALGPFEAEWVEFGYYGQFNQVQRIIRSLPGLKIVDHWQHHDISIEDFGFQIEKAGGERRWVHFYEKSPQMRLHADRDIEQFIRLQMQSGDASSPPPRHMHNPR